MRVLKSLFRCFCIICLCICPVCAGAADFRIVASTFPVYLFAANICAGARDVRLELLIPAGVGCPHDFSLSPADLRKLSRASAIIINGGQLEEFLDKPLRGLERQIPVIDAGRGVPLLPGVPEAGHGEHAHANAHIFAAPKTAIAMVANIASGLSGADEANADIYKNNALAYAAKLRGISERLEKVGQRAPNRKIALGHDALAYLASNANLDVVAVFENGDSVARLNRQKRLLLQEMPALLAGDSQYPDKLLKTLARETDIPWAVLNTCASGPPDAAPDYYEQAMEENLKILGAYFDQAR